MDKEIAILMACYNGEKYLKEQIGSIISQTYSRWKLYIRDDGSTDGTLEIVRNYSRIDNRITLIDDSEKHLGPSKSFMRLLQSTHSDLYMFCDQDDVWLPEKIKKSLDAYDSFGNNNIPIVVHTDVVIVNEELDTLAKSHWKDCHLDPDRLKSYNFLALCCYTQGNTMLFNDQAKQLCSPYTGLFMHDWWVSTRVLRSNGVILSVKEPLVLYRQHTNNVMGFSYGRNNSIRNKIKNLRNNFHSNYVIYKRLKSDNYGSIFKYIYYKWLLLFHMRVKK